MTADGETRLTLDYKLKSFDQRFSSAPNIRYCVPLINEVIIELKSSVESSTALARLMVDFPFRFENIRNMLLITKHAGLSRRV